MPFNKLCDSCVMNLKVRMCWTLGTRILMPRFRISQKILFRMQISSQIDDFVQYQKPYRRVWLDDLIDITESRLYACENFNDSIMKFLHYFMQIFRSIHAIAVKAELLYSLPSSLCGNGEISTSASQCAVGYPGLFPSALLLTFRLISEFRQTRPDFRHSVRISALYYSQRRNQLTDLLASALDGSFRITLKW